jgi:outer membrane protein assembly factor BamA
MRAAALGLAGALLIFVAAPVAADVADYIGKPVASVRITAEGRGVSNPRLLELIETPVGTPLNISAVRETVTHLFALGRYEDVIVHADQTAAGVVLVYDLVPLHPIETIHFAGPIESGVDTRRLRRVIRDRFGTAPLPQNRPTLRGRR